MNGPFVPRTYPMTEGAAGAPFIQPDGRGRYFVARYILQGGALTVEYALDPEGRLEAEATHLVRTHLWSKDHGEAPYPATEEIAAAATFGQREPNLYMSAETALVHIEANQREYSEAKRQYDREYTIDDYPEM